MEELINKVEQWAHDQNIINGSDSKTQMLKLISEIGELADNINKGRDCRDDIGDCLVVLTIIAAQQGITLMDCLSVAYNDIKQRKGVLYDGVFIKDTDDAYDDAVKMIASRLNLPQSLQEQA